ncbi:MAG: hypothetical protein MUO85_01100 [candidate division Zixibacteria bacterium]|nr:hypothetical protein [candidate division Zixibacteria bacterium]
MKKPIWQIMMSLFIVLMFLYSNSLAGSLVERERLSVQQEIAKLEYSSYEQNKKGQDKGMEEDIYQYEHKSTRKAFIYSLFVPGSGEYYAESKTKTAVFLGLEAAFWIGYFNYHSKGKDKENEYEVYADQNWSEDDYLQWLRESGYCTNNPTSDRDSCVHNGTTKYWTEHLPDTKNQEYYEMIGKYEQFVYGWKDTYYPTDDTSALREIYMDMRHDANKLFDKAKYSVMAVLANHLLSAFDAAWTAKKYNQRADRFARIDFKVRMVGYENELVPKAFVTFKF